MVYALFHGHDPCPAPLPNIIKRNVEHLGRMGQGPYRNIIHARLGNAPHRFQCNVAGGYQLCPAGRQFLGATQTTEDVICGFEAAWQFFGGVFPVVIPDNMSSIVKKAENTAPRRPLSNPTEFAISAQV